MLIAPNEEPATFSSSPPPSGLVNTKNDTRCHLDDHAIHQPTASVNKTTNIEASSPCSQYSDNEWHRLLPKLGLSALPLQLAEHCLLKEFTENRLVLWLDHSATDLQRSGLKQQVQAAVSQYFKHDISVQWVLADLGVETPEQQRQQRKKRLQQLAIDSIYQDAFVQHLKQDFSATLIDASIRPKKSE